LPASDNPAEHRAVRPLGRGEIPVWWMRTDALTPADCDRWLDILDRDERDRAARFHFEQHRREYIAAHALVRTMLTFYLGCPAPAWRFSLDQYGKPSIASASGAPEFQFNLSHTSGLVAATVAAHGKIGIDVETIDQTKADFAVAEAYFARSEVEILRRMPEAERALWFFRFWALKESYIKAIGTGLSTPLDSFAFAFEPIRISFRADIDDDPTRWHFEMVGVTDQHVLSVAVGRPAGPVGDTIQVLPRAILPRDI
jgi:4'-phosphopantetheinyl transferase